MATSDTYKALYASGSININLSLEEVWGKLTIPFKNYDWIANENENQSYIKSSWQEGKPVNWKYLDEETKKEEDYYRGVITKLSLHKLIEFSIHDAYEEDNTEEGFDPDWGEETWTFEFAKDGNQTKLSLRMGDYDEDHVTDDSHDHKEAVETCKKVEKETIPNMLKKIKSTCEK